MSKTLLMYDCVPSNVHTVPDHAKAVAGYVDGNYRSYPLLVARFHGRAHVVSIGVFLGHTAEFTDVETGNPINTPDLVRADYEHRKAHGVWRPGYYGDQSHMDSVILPGLAGIPDSDYRLWLAKWDGNPDTIPGGYCAKQYTNNRRANGGDGPYDTSVVDIAEMFKEHREPKPVHRHITRHEVKKLIAHHKKTVGSAAGGGAGIVIATLIHNIAHVHFTTAEASGISALLGYIISYLSPNGYLGK